MSHFAIKHNAQAARRSEYPFGHLLCTAAARLARTDMARCPLYAPTPLLDLHSIARAAGVSRVFYKDEAGRFGIGSFKALGGAYAVARMLAQKVSQQLGAEVTAAELALGFHGDLTREPTVVCASDGNHGRSVAAGAQVFGCKAVISLHEGVSAAREDAINKHEALIIRTAGNYDDSVRAAMEAADAQGWQLVADTSWPGYHAVPAMVMQGYTVMVLEILEQLRTTAEPFPTHVFLQGGVGGLAAAVVAHFWEELGPMRTPTFIVVEPELADCLYQSALAGTPTPARGDLNTLMAGLACGEVSQLAWEILAAGAEFFMTIPDKPAVAAMRLLARPANGDPGVVAGESAAAGLADLLALTQDTKSRNIVLRTRALDPNSRVLLFGTEGATDPQLYRTLVGG